VRMNNLETVSRSRGKGKRERRVSLGTLKPNENCWCPSRRREVTSENLKQILVKGWDKARKPRSGGGRLPTRKRKTGEKKKNVDRKGGR